MIPDTMTGSVRLESREVYWTLAPVILLLAIRRPGLAGGVTMPKPKKAGGRVVKMSPLTIARIEAELLALAAALKARVPDLTPAKLQALKKRLRRAMGLIR